MRNHLSELGKARCDRKDLKLASYANRPSYTTACKVREESEKLLKQLKSSINLLIEMRLMGEQEHIE